MTTNQSKPSPAGVSQKTAAVIIMLIVAFFSLFISINHYSDGGCDGGLCALAFIFHALPLLIAWVVLIIAYLLYQRFPIASTILTAASGIINFEVANLDYGTQNLDMLQPVIVLVVAQAWTGFLSIAALLSKK